MFVGNIFSAPTENVNLLCQIKDQTILDINEGISEKYNGFKDEAESGDTILINFNYSLERVSFRSEDYSPLKISSSAWTPTVMSDEKLLITRGLIGYYVYAHSAEIEFSEDRFNIEDNSLNRYLRFERYYKNDWQMTFTDVFSGIIVVGNCMNQSGFQRVLNYYDKYTEKN